MKGQCTQSTYPPQCNYYVTDQTRNAKLDSKIISADIARAANTPPEPKGWNAMAALEEPEAVLEMPAGFLPSK